MFQDGNKWTIAPQKDGLLTALQINSVLYSKTVDDILIEVIDFKTYGKSFLINKNIQCAESDEKTYYESLVLPALLSHPAPKNILIVGGATGGALRQCLRDKRVEKVTFINQVEQLVAACKKHLPEVSAGAFDDKRVNLHFGDLNKLITADLAKEKFDLVIVDLPDDDTSLMFKKSLYVNLKAVLTEAGVLVTHAGNANLLLADKVFDVVKPIVAGVFGKTTVYTSYINSFDGLHGFIMASDKTDIIKKEDVNDKLKALVEKEDTYFYDGESHASMVALPPHLRD